MRNQVIISIGQAIKYIEQDDAIILDATIDKVNQPIDNSRLELIPNTLFFDIEHNFSDKSSGLPHTVVNPEKFSLEAKKLGINQDSTLVIYDRWGIYSSPRAWWMFRFMGFKKVFVLDGGIPGWKAAGLPLSSTYAEPKEQGNFEAIQQNNWIISKEDLYANLDNINIIDARSSERFNGIVSEPRLGVRSGHIPGSSNLPFQEIINEVEYKDKEELEKMFEKTLNKDGINIFTCGSGVTASILALAAYQIGYDHIAIYDGSWAEWGSDPNMPIEK